MLERGSAEWRAGRRTYVSTPGSVHVLPPGTFHCSAGHITEGDFTAILLTDGAMLTEPSEDGPAFEARTHKVDAAALSARVAAVLSASTSNDDPLRAESALLLALETMRSLSGNAFVEVGRAPAAVRRMREFLHAEAAGAMTLAELARSGGISKYHALRTFKRELGVTPFEYLMHVRVSRAADLLRTGSSATEAAHEAGFTDQSHLLRWFKRTQRMTPSAYARAFGARRGAP